MILSLIVYLIPYVLGIVLLVSFIGAYTNLRRSRKAPYFRIRRDSAQRGWQWALILLVSLVSIGVAVFARRYVPQMDFASLRTSPTPLPTLSLELTPSDSLELNTSPTTAFNIPPTITPTLPTPTITPTPVIATIESNIEVPPNAELVVTDISSDISSALTPVNTSTIFPAGTQRLYFWIEFTNLVDGISWSQVLLLNGSVVRSESEAWNQSSEGIAYYWFEAQGGWPGGSYEIQFYLGDKLAASETFSIVD